MQGRKFIVIAMGVGLLSTAQPAFAYVDPGTGAMLVQALLAVVAAAIFYFRNPDQLWRDIKRWLLKIRNQ